VLAHNPICHQKGKNLTSEQVHLADQAADGFEVQVNCGICTFYQRVHERASQQMAQE